MFDAEDDEIAKNKQKLLDRMTKKKADSRKSPPSNKDKKGKKARKWDNEGQTTDGLDYSAPAVSLKSIIIRDLSPNLHQIAAEHIEM